MGEAFQKHRGVQDSVLIARASSVKESAKAAGGEGHRVGENTRGPGLEKLVLFSLALEG